ncbi:MAG: hypothetical protein B5M56_03760 [Desulfococcus sp. 4484_241]|nr:MAG: hypothetical protein B5M56_03760 [Desulfococcus sp. 4484_241]
MSSREEQVLRAAKEVAVKFIEVGRVSPSNFPEIFRNIYEAIDRAAGKTKDNESAAAKKKKS